MRFGLPILDHSTALAHLLDLVALRDDALREPLPLYCATSYAFVVADREGDGDRDPVTAAASEWTTKPFGWAKEDSEAEHLLVLGGQRGVDDVVDDPRFRALAHRLWDPILDEAWRWSS